jgi:hypothetical protein
MLNEFIVAVDLQLSAVPLRLFTKGSSTLHSNESSGRPWVAGWWGAWVSYDVGRTPCNSESQSIWSICIGHPTALDCFSVNIKLGPTFLFFLWLSILWLTGFAELKATTRMMWVSRICLFSTYFVNKIAPNRGIKLTTVHWGWHRWVHCTLSKYHPFHKSQTLLCHTEHKKSWMLTLIIVNRTAAIDAHERPLFEKLLWGLVSSTIFVRC